MCSAATLGLWLWDPPIVELGELTKLFYNHKSTSEFVVKQHWFGGWVGAAGRGMGGHMQ